MVAVGFVLTRNHLHVAASRLALVKDTLSIFTACASTVTPSVAPAAIVALVWGRTLINVYLVLTRFGKRGVAVVFCAVSAEYAGLLQRPFVGGPESGKGVIVQGVTAQQAQQRERGSAVRTQTMCRMQVSVSVTLKVCEADLYLAQDAQ